MSQFCEYLAQTRSPNHSVETAQDKDTEERGQELPS